MLRTLFCSFTFFFFFAINLGGPPSKRKGKKDEQLPKKHNISGVKQLPEGARLVNGGRQTISGECI